MTESPQTRRTILQGASGLAATAALSPLALSSSQDRAGAAGDAELRVGLVGCGGRGKGATIQALNTGGVRLVAVADAFQDRADDAVQELKGAHPKNVDVTRENMHLGFDAYKKVIDSDVDVVVLATPPGFRAQHFEYAVSKGKHVFMEKPVAVDGPGVRKVLAAAKVAKEKNLKVGVGLQRHHSKKYQQTINAIHDGAIGRPLFTRVYWNSAGVWVKPRREDWSEMQYQMRNWYYFNWLCGDHITEQHIHNLDVGNWVMDSLPVKAAGMGGRQVRTGSKHGEIYDHFAIEYTYDDGAKMISQCRHHPNTQNAVVEYAHGSEGTSLIQSGKIEQYEGEGWRFKGESPNPYQVEHDVLFEAIRKDLPHNEAERGANATLTAILGRMAAYSGKTVTWEQAMNSKRILAPEVAELTWDTMPKSLPMENGLYPIPTPGEYEII